MKKPFIKYLNKFLNSKGGIMKLLKGGKVNSDGGKSLNLPRLIIAIVVIIVIIILIILIIKYIINSFRSETMDGDCSSEKGCLLLSQPKNGLQPMTLKDLDLPSSGSEGYSISIWLYVKSSNFVKRVRKFKSIMYRGNPGASDSGFTDKQSSVQPGVWLYGNTNKILLRWETRGRVGSMPCCSQLGNPCNVGDSCIDEDETIKTCISKDGNNYLIAKDNSTSSMNPYINPPNKLCSAVLTKNEILWNTSDANTDNETCIDNIPLDRWFQLAIVMQSQSVDIYVDGKLYSTITLNSMPSFGDGSAFVLSEDNSPLYNSLNGFSGAMTQLRYFNYSLSPDDIANVYSWGPHPHVPKKIKSSKDDSSNKNNDDDDENNNNSYEEADHDCGTDYY